MRSRRILPSRLIVGFSGGADSRPGSDASSASVARGGRTGRSRVPPRIRSVAFSGLARSSASKPWTERASPGDRRGIPRPYH